MRKCIIMNILRALLSETKVRGVFLSPSRQCSCGEPPFCPISDGLSRVVSIKSKLVLVMDWRLQNRTI